MNEKDRQALTELLNRECVVATGCTEPIAAAYAAAVAAERAGEAVRRIEVTVDGGLYKNAAAVGIPGIRQRGLPIASALGAVIADGKRGLRVLEDIKSEELAAAEELVKAGAVSVSIKEGYEKLYVEVNVITDHKRVRAVALNRHQNIVAVQEGADLPPFDPAPYLTGDAPTGAKTNNDFIHTYSLADLLDFVNEAPISDLLFLREGVEMGKKIADRGLAMQEGSFGHAMGDILKSGAEGDNLVTRAQILSGAASEARMSGAVCPVMTTAGSGNHGLTVFLTCIAVAQVQGTDEEQLLRALALGNLVTVYIKSYTGTLSVMCGCGVAAGVGAAAGAAYLLDGSETVVYRAIVNMVGSIAGLLCDGGKESCAYKVALSAGWAVQSALLGKNGGCINSRTGILSERLQDMFKNLGDCTVSMAPANQSILNIIRKNEMC
ncbi:MAG: serine dehydratase subunit alpha family protein [Clostridia bacterium]|nr:serine dehydratase subunit alpha family protein [Clostridia bacterium]